jgi:uncharacterized integral membrane protein
MPDPDESVEQRKFSPSLIAGVLIALAAIDFIAQNRQQITIHFLFFTIEAKVWVALVVTGVLSILAAEFLGGHLRRRKKKD